MLSYFHSFGREQAFPMVVGYTVLSFAFGVAQAFLLFGIMQVYLSRITSAHLRLGPWEVPGSGIMVLAVIMIPDFMMLARQIIAGYPFHAAATLVKVMGTGVVTLASSYWFERSRSLAAPMIAFGLFTGLFPVLFNLRFLLLR
jgi:hypothetical protein